MSEYLIQQDLMTAYAAQIRRICGIEETLNGAMIGELLSQIQGSISEANGKYLVRAIGYSGEVLKTSYLDSGAVFSFPTETNPPEGYVCIGWKSSIPIGSNYVVVSDSDIDIQAIYDTESGATEFTTISTDYVYLPIPSGSLVDWGDGKTSTLNEHRYSSTGIYNIKAYDVTETYKHSTISSRNRFSSVKLAHSVTSIVDNTFAECSNLQNIALGDNIAEIGNFALAYTGLVNILIPTSVKSLGYSVFQGCTGLINVTIPDSVTSIGNTTHDTSLFRECTALKEVVISKNVSHYFAMCADCTSLERVVVAADATCRLPAQLFYNSDSADFPYTLKTVEFRGGTKIIAQVLGYVLNNANSITDIVIHNGINSIEAYAFFDQTTLTNVTIPSSVTAIGECAFDGCTGLTSAIYEGTEEEWANVTVGIDNEYLTNVLTFAG